MAAPAAIQRLGPCVWELGPDHREGMRVPVRIFASDKLLAEMDEKVFEQAANVATLPGIVDASLCMPDAHWGYGFPIGGVAAMDVRSGVISPGGIGFDINCGMRLVRTDLTWPEVQPAAAASCSTRSRRACPRASDATASCRSTATSSARCSREGARWAVARGYGTADDLARTEAGGCFAAADPDCVSERAVERGYRQLGTLGSGNHYLEIQVLHREGVFDASSRRPSGSTCPSRW